jgi:aspartate/methionine/tyrosine aminotransferase
MASPSLQRASTLSLKIAPCLFTVQDLAIPGYRVGAIVGDPALLDESAKLIDCISICAPRLGQEAVIAGLTEAGEWRAEKVAELATKQKRFEEVMSAKPGGFELLAAGAYYGWVRHPFSESSNSVAKRLLVEQGVLVIPGEAFGPTDPGCLRFSFANADINRLEELTSRLAALGEMVK